MQYIEPQTKLWVDERQSHVEPIFEMERDAWWFHGSKFQLGNGPTWGSRSPLTSFVCGSIVISLFLFLMALVIIPCQATDAATNSMSKQQAYQLLKAGNSSAVRSLATGDREILLAKLALDAGRTNEALRLLSSARMEKKPLAAVIRAEAYRQQSVAAARRAGHYAHAVSEDIHKLEKARFNAGLAQAEKRLQAFMSGHAAIEPVRTGHVIAANTKTSKSRLPDSVRLAINAWRNDWESRHADAYLSHYDRDFRTIKYNYTSWSSYKRHINSRKKYISVTLSDLKLIRGPEKIPQGEGILVTFKQRYKSSNYAANSRKQLYLVRRGNHDKWLIMYEGEASRPYHPPHTKAAGQISLNISLNSTNVLKIARTGSWAINLGSFDSAANAEQMASGIHLTSSQRPFVSSASIHGKAVHRVRIGLYQSRNDAVDAMIKICPELGLTDCWLEQVKK